MKSASWDRFDSLTVVGCLITAVGLGMWSVALSLVWLGACALFVGLRGSLWAS